MEAVEIIEGKDGLQAAIYYEEDAQDPRREFDHAGTMACFHRRYRLGDEHDFDGPEDLETHLKQDTRGVALPLYLYDHSGVTMQTRPFSCPWDSGQVGYIFMDAQTIRKAYGVKRISKKAREKALALLECEVKEYDSFLTGDIYCVAVEKDGDTLDSVCGLYGLDYAKEEARRMLEEHESNEQKKEA